MAGALVDDLRAALGSTAVLTGADAGPHLVDWRGAFRGAAVAVVKPSSTDEVAAVVRSCAEHGAAVVGQGGNTGLSGGSVPTTQQPTIVVSLSRMNRIASIDPDQYTITAEAGCTVQAIQEAASGVDRLFAPDWGARGTATLGGAIATNAGGINVLRYGTMRDNVLGLEVVLPDGRVWNGLRALRKDSSGYDLKQLFIGSEGTLGLVTRAIVRLHAATPFQQTAFAALTSLDALLPVLELARSHAQDGVNAYELLPEVGLARTLEVFPALVRPLDTVAEWYVLIRFAGVEPPADALSNFLADAAERALIVDAVLAATADQERNLWTIRDELPAPGIFPLHVHGLKLDTAVPIDRIGEYFDAVCGIAAELAPEVLAYGFGHAGDGNIHMSVLPLDEDDVEGFLAVKPELERRIDELTWKLGGTISAEHGIGVELRDRIAGQKPPIELELMRRVKSALDPDGRCNPGKLLPD